MVTPPLDTATGRLDQGSEQPALAWKLALL